MKAPGSWGGCAGGLRTPGCQSTAGSGAEGPPSFLLLRIRSPTFALLLSRGIRKVYGGSPSWAGVVPTLGSQTKQGNQQRSIRGLKWAGFLGGGGHSLNLVERLVFITKRKYRAPPFTSEGSVPHGVCWSCYNYTSPRGRQLP